MRYYSDSSSFGQRTFFRNFVWNVCLGTFLEFLHPSPMCVKVGGGGLPTQYQTIFGHQQGVRIQLNSTQFWHYLSRDSIFRKWRPLSHKTALHYRCQSKAQVVTCASDQPATNEITRPGCYLYFWPAGYKSEVHSYNSLLGCN